MKQTKFSILIILFLSIIGCGQGTEQNKQTEIPNNWNLLNDSLYSIRYPDNWGLNTSGLKGTSFILVTAQSSLQDRYNENISLVIQDLTGQNINLDEYVETSEELINTKITNGILLESERLNSNDLDFHKLIYTSRQGVYNLKYEQYFWIENSKAYVLTLTCKVNEFKKYQKTGEKIMNSFRLK